MLASGPTARQTVSHAISRSLPATARRRRLSPTSTSDSILAVASRAAAHVCDVQTGHAAVGQLARELVVAAHASLDLHDRRDLARRARGQRGRAQPESSGADTTSAGAARAR
jgi:hypothetical protein